MREGSAHTWRQLGACHGHASNLLSSDIAQPLRLPDASAKDHELQELLLLLVMASSLSQAQSSSDEHVGSHLASKGSIVMREHGDTFCGTSLALMNTSNSSLPAKLGKHNTLYGLPVEDCALIQLRALKQKTV